MSVFFIEFKIVFLIIYLGQVCCAGTRTYIQESLYDEFVERSVERAKKKIVGNPFDLKTEQGPQIDGDQMEKILGLVKEGVNQGAKLLTGGERHGDTGYFVKPTVFAEVEDDNVIAREEVIFLEFILFQVLYHKNLYLRSSLGCILKVHAFASDI